VDTVSDVGMRYFSLTTLARRPVLAPSTYTPKSPAVSSPVGHSTSTTLRMACGLWPAWTWACACDALTKYTPGAKARTSFAPSRHREAARVSAGNLSW